MEKNALSNQHSELPAGQTSSCAERSCAVAGVSQHRTPPTRGITSKPRQGWPKARADLNTAFSCLTAGIREGWGLPRERTRSHRHKPACKKFLLEVRKILPVMMLKCGNRASRKTAESPGFGKMQNWNGLRPEQIGLPPPPLSEGRIRCPHVPPELICCDTILCSCAWAQENSVSMHQVLST